MTTMTIYHVSDEHRKTALKVLDEVSKMYIAVKSATGKGLHCAVWFSVSPITGHLDSGYSFFDNFVDADIWISERFEVKSKLCPFVQTYLNGEMKDHS